METTNPQYHVARNGEQIGTFSEEEILQKLQKNELSPLDLCWTKGMPDWQTLSLQFPSANPSGTPPLPGSSLPTTPASNLPLASLGDRFFAAMLDGLFTLLIAVPAGVAAAVYNPENVSGLFIGLTALTVVLFLALLTYTLILLATRGQTLGKRILGIRIVTFPDGQNPGGVKTILLRVIVNGLIAAIPLVGNVYSLVDICFIFRQDRRCIHDLLAGTQVIKGQPVNP